MNGARSTGVLGLEEKQPPRPWSISISSGLPRGRERWGCISCPIPRPPDGTDQRHIRLVIDDVEVYQCRLTGAGEKITSAETIPSHFFCRDPFDNLLEFTMIQGNKPKASKTLCFTLQIAGKLLI